MYTTDFNIPQNFLHKWVSVQWRICCRNYSEDLETTSACYAPLQPCRSTPRLWTLPPPTWSLWSSSSSFGSSTLRSSSVSVVNKLLLEVCICGDILWGRGVGVDVACRSVFSSSGEIVQELRRQDACSRGHELVRYVSDTGAVVGQPLGALRGILLRCPALLSV